MLTKLLEDLEEPAPGLTSWNNRTELLASDLVMG